MSLDRRTLLKSAVATAAGGAALPLLTESREPLVHLDTRRGPVLTSVKWGMIRVKADVMGKFKLMKELGYDGMELVSPLGNLDINALLKARDATGMPIHGVVDSVHWNKSHRLSSPDPVARERGRKALEQAVRDSHALGGTAVLLVPGVVDKEVKHDQCWERSTAEVKKVLPVCAKLGIHILMENVWNGFCYSPEQAAEYIDGFSSPWVGAYFDIGNHVKYGKSEHWIRTLGKRIVKLDVKDWGQKNGFCKIGDGDCNWPEVRKAVAEIGFTGWSTAEVRGGGKDRMAEVKERMDRFLVKG